jgi:hypothetical protein
MDKYNVGDVVKLRDDLVIGEEYGAVVFLYSMKTLKNKALRIDSIDTEDDECVVYEIDGWWISEEMIEGLWEEKQDKLKLIDVLNMIAKGELKEGTKVKVRENMYSFNDNDLKREDDEDFVITVFEEHSFAVLDIEVELIEPPCEHECIADIGKSIEPADNTKIEELNIDFGNEIITCNHFQILATNKLNEVINKVNAQTTVLLAQDKYIKEIQEQLDY